MKVPKYDNILKRGHSKMRKNLKEARQAAGLTQRQMAEYLKITLRSYQRIEEGSLLGSIRIWDALEDLLKIHQRIWRSEMPLPEVAEK